MFQPVNNQSNYEIIVEQIKTMIISGELRIGDQLPSERDMMGSFDVSRSSLREALKALEAIGVLESRQGGGHYIVNKIGKRITDSLSLAFSMDDGELGDLIQLRRALETEVLRSIIVNNDEEAFLALREIGERFKTAATVDEMSDLDTLFHNTVTSLSHNRMLHYIYSSLLSVYLDSVSFANETLRGWDSIEDMRNYERGIFDALETKDWDTVLKAIDAHYTYNQKKISKITIPEIKHHLS